MSIYAVSLALEHLAHGWLDAKTIHGSKTDHILHFVERFRVNVEF